MMEWVAATLLVAGFILLLKPFRVISTSRHVLVLSQQVLAVLGNAKLSDLEKEKAMQRHSVAFLRCFFLILLGGAGALLLPYGLVWLLDLFGLVSLQGTLLITLRWPFLVGATAVGVFVLLIQHKAGSRT